MSRFSWLPNASQMSLSEILKSYFDELNSKQISTLLLSSEDFASFNSVDFSQLIGSLPQGEQFNLEVIFFDFNPKNRLKAYQNQFIQQGEFVDSNTIKEIIKRISRIKRDFEDAVSVHPIIVHWVNYESLRTPTEIYEQSLDLILNSSKNLIRGNWSIPVKMLNTSIPLEKIELLNKFNKIINGGRQFDFSCPVVFSNLFPEQKNRFNRFTQLLNEFPECDRTTAERDSIPNSTIWKFFSPYRKLIRLMRKI